MPQERNYCVYCHTNKFNGKRYVGITCRTPEERWRNGTQYYHNEHFYRAIQKYGWDGFLHDILHTELTQSEACEYERQYIKDWNLRYDSFGYNLTDGGEGCCGRVLSDETKAKISASHMGIGKAVPLSEEHKRNISRAMTGVPHPHKSPKRGPMSEELKAVLSEAHKKSVAMYSMDDEYIMSFASAIDAANYVGLKTKGDISKCCHGKRKSCGGYKWRYLDDEKLPV